MTGAKTGAAQAAPAVLTLTISGELYRQLDETTSLDDGHGDVAIWGYGESRVVDVEVHTMIKHGATSKRAGFGRRVTMTGSPQAWQAIAHFAADRAELERDGIGDFDRGLGTRLQQQADRIEAMLR